MTQVAVVQRCSMCAAKIGSDGRYCESCGYARQPGQVPGVDPATSPSRSMLNAPDWAPPASAVLLPTRPSYRGIVAASIAIGVIVVLTVPLLLVRSAFFGPTDVAQDYFAALHDRNADAAWATLSVKDRGARSASPLYASGVLRGRGYTPPDKVVVGATDKNGAKATVKVDYQVQGQPASTELKLVRGGAGSGLLQRWHITNGLWTLDIPVSTSVPVQVAGLPVPPKEYGADPLHAFPGSYAVTMVDSPLVGLPPIQVTSGVSSRVEQIDPVIKPDADKKIREQVRAWLDKCAASRSAEPEGCPFQVNYSYDTVLDTSWKITRYPELALELRQNSESDGGFAVRVSSNSGRVTATLRTDSKYDPTDDWTDNFTVSGTASTVNGTITFQPDD